MPSEADRIVQEAEEALPSVIRWKESLTAVHSSKHAQITVGYKALMREAVPLLRHRHCPNRAEAVETCFDFLLQKGTNSEWERVGEVRLDRHAGVAEALCVKLPTEKELEKEKETDADS